MGRQGGNEGIEMWKGRGKGKGGNGITEVGGDGEIEGQDRKRKGRWERVKEEGREGGKKGRKEARQQERKWEMSSCFPLGLQRSVQWARMAAAV